MLFTFFFILILKMHLFLKISNILAYVVFLHATIHNTVDFTDDGLIRHKETYITPCKYIHLWLALRVFNRRKASWVSDIWVIIHLLLGGFTIYQWFEPAHKATTYGVGWYFVLSAILSYVWLTLLVRLWYRLGMILLTKYFMLDIRIHYHWNHFQPSDCLCCFSHLLLVDVYYVHKISIRLTILCYR